MLLYILEDSKIIGSETVKFAVFSAILEDKGLVDVYINNDNQATEAMWQKWNIGRGSFVALIKVSFNEKERTMKGYLSSAKVIILNSFIFINFLFSFVDKKVILRKWYSRGELISVPVVL